MRLAPWPHRAAGSRRLLRYLRVPAYKMVQKMHHEPSSLFQQPCGSVISLVTTLVICTKHQAANHTDSKIRVQAHDRSHSTPVWASGTGVQYYESAVGVCSTTIVLVLQ